MTDQLERELRSTFDRIAADPPPPGLADAAMRQATRARSARWGVAGTVAGLATVGVIAAGTLAGGPQPGAPAAGSGSPTAPPTGAGRGAAPTIPGMSAAQAAAITAGCVRSFAGGGDLASVTTPTAAPPGSSTTPGISTTPGASTTPGLETTPGIPATPGRSATPGISVTPGAPVSPGISATPGISVTPGAWVRPGEDQAHVYNVVRDAAGTVALVYAPDTVLTCDVGGPVGAYNAGGGGLAGGLAWLPGPVSVDLENSTAGGRRAGKYPTQRGDELVAGRVAGNVAQVTVSLGSERRTVRPVNGTYLVRFVHSVDWPIPAASPPLAVRGYDAGGRLVTGAPGTSAACYITPNGEVLGSSWPKPGRHCQPAVPWR